MTLTELKYIVAVAREKHFGRAADACHVSQPTLSVAVKKLEDELELKIFERSAAEVAITPLGEEIVRQAQAVLEQAAGIREIARRGKDPLAGALTLGIIYTIGPYLLPDLVRNAIARTPQMPLMLQENFTVKLLEMLRTGEIDCAIMAEPFPDTGLATAALYDEPFLAAVPSTHPLASQSEVTAEQMKSETMLLLGTGHCFRDHVLEVCPEFARFSSNAEGIRKSFEGSSLETIKHMVAAGMGVTLVPRLSVPPGEPIAGVPEGAGESKGGGDAVDSPVGQRCIRCEPCPPPAPTHRRPGPAPGLPPVFRCPADPPRGAGLAPQLHPVRGHRSAAQRGLCLRAAGCDAAFVRERWHWFIFEGPAAPTRSCAAFPPHAAAAGWGARLAPNGADSVALLRCRASPAYSARLEERIRFPLATHHSPKEFQSPWPRHPATSRASRT